MASYNLDLRDPQTVLRILTVLVEQHDGELTFPAEDYDSLEKPKLLVVNYSRKKGIVFLRTTADFGSAVPVHPEAANWTNPPQTAPLERARSEAAQQARRVAVPSDEELADLEEKMQARQNLAAMEAEGKAPLRIRTHILCEVMTPKDITELSMKIDENMRGKNAAHNGNPLDAVREFLGAKVH
jgi:hypothetical protein